MKLTIETHCKKCGAEYKGVIPPSEIEVALGIDPVDVYVWLKCDKCKKDFIIVINN